MKKNKKRMIIFTTIFFLLAGCFTVMVFDRQGSTSAATKEVRAVWLAYVNYSALGLKTDDEATFRKNAEAFLKKAKSNYINTVYFHVRAFDDAAWKSTIFKPSKHLTSKSTFAFDPLEVMVELTHAKGMELHAWMNPYRISFDYFLDPALDSTTNRINTAVTEVMAYNVDGIHFDDYFYNAKKGYKNVSGTVTVTKSNLPTKAKRKANVNKMVLAVYAKTKELDKNAQFGISPQGNLDNCRSAGADIDTWLSEDGYLDYIVPQIYWTNCWGSKGNVTMFSDRLKAWKALNTKKKPMYIGLAAYRTGISYKDDPGWKKSSSNLARQLNLLRANGCKGYALFAATDLSRSGAKKELAKLRKMVKRIPTMKISRVDYQTLSFKWNKISGVSGYEIHRATSKEGTYKKIATIDGAATIKYTRTGLTPDKIYYYKIRSYRTATPANVFNPLSSPIKKAAKPKTPKAGSKAEVKKITVTWKQVPNVTGYVVYRSTSKSGTYQKRKTVSARKQLQYVNKKLTSGKRYYYKVRAYKTVDGKRVYSNYSAITTKKAK